MTQKLEDEAQLEREWAVRLEIMDRFCVGQEGQRAREHVRAI